jgi:acyl carrier protein
MDMEDMRKAVYSLIRSLLDTESSDDEMDAGMDADMDGEDSIDFSVRGDTGEKPAKNELR